MNPYVAEFLGTMLLILMGDGVVANVVLKGTKGNNGGWIVITTAWALGVFIGVVVAGPYSGAHLNPAVSLGLAVTGQFPWNLVPGYIFAQMAGAALGALLVYLFYRDHFAITDDPAGKLAIFCTTPSIRNYRSNFLSEVIVTFVLVFVVLSFQGAYLDDTANTPVGLGSLGALPVALLVWVIGLALGGATGYAINPARDLAPRTIHALLPVPGKGTSDWSYAWIPVAGPCTGALLAAFLFLVIR